MAKRTIYQRIMQAAKRGTGLRLSADDVARLSADSAIWMAARHYDEMEAFHGWKHDKATQEQES